MNKLIFIFILLFALLISLVSACYTPLIDDNYINNDTTLCFGSYSLTDDEYSYDANYSVFIVNASNVIFDCNNSIINGTGQGEFVKTVSGITNVTIKNCQVTNFVGGIELSSSNSLIKNINLTHMDNVGGGMCDRTAICLSNSNITVSNIFTNYMNTGINLGSGLNNISVSNIFVNNSLWRGFDAYSLSNSTIKDSKVKNSEVGFNDAISVNITLNNFTTINISEIGVNFYGTKNSTVKNSNISNTTTGILLRKRSTVTAQGNLFYNNYFSNNGIHINSSNEKPNYYNTTKTLGTNIIGGSYIGGNYYDEYTGTDSDNDGIGETTYEIISEYGGQFDYLPLTNNVSTFASNCYTPTGGNENTHFNQTSGSNLTLCNGNYSFNDIGSPDGVFYLDGENYVFDCNYSNLYGNQSGSRIGIMFMITGENITLKNCQIKEFVKGINITSTANQTRLRNLTFYKNMNNDIVVYANNTNFQSLSSIGDGNGDAAIKFVYTENNIVMDTNISTTNNAILLGQTNNVSIDNIRLIEVYSYGVFLDNSNNNSLSNSYLQSISSHAFQINGNQNVFDNITINGTSYNGFNIMGNGNIIKNSNISNVAEWGIIFSQDSNSENNFIYNNYFSNNGKGHINLTSNFNNTFNITKTLGTNIIGGSYIGGNYYDDYNGTDGDNDGIGETSYEIYSDIVSVYDYLPLTNNQTPATPTVFNGSVNVSFSALNGFYEGNIVEFEINFSNFTSPTNASINFDDGNTSIYTNITSPYHVNHTYLDNNGLDNYTINVTVYDGTNSKTNISSLEILNTVPFNLSWVYQTNQNSSFSFQPTFTDNGSLDTHTAFVFWGDGSNLTTTVTGFDSVHHNYSSDGNYTINFSITDNDNATSNFVSFNVSLHDDNFSISGNQIIYKNSLENITTFIDYLTTQNISINWGDSNITFDANESNNNSYTHNYTSFGSYIINATLRGHRSGEAHAGPENYYYATLNINVIGCGDGIIQDGEECDSSNLNSKTCSNYGFNAGSLSCSNSCVIDSSDCYTHSNGGGSGGSVSTTPKKNDTVVEVNESLLNKTLFNNTNKNLTVNVSELVNMTFNKTLFNKTFENMNVTINATELNVTLNETLNETNTTNVTLLKTDLNLLFSKLLFANATNNTILENSLQDLFSKLTFKEEIKNKLLQPINDLFNKLLIEKKNKTDLPVHELINTSCEENWTCEDWGLCQINNTQNRICFDESNCKTSQDKPIITQECNYLEEANRTLSLLRLQGIFSKLNIPDVAEQRAFDKEKARQEQEEEYNCLHDIDFVCGINGITYNNSCQAERANVTVKTQGVCPKIIEDSPDNLNENCDDGNLCTRDYFEDGSCHNVQRPNGFVCDSGKICYEHKCLDQEEALQKYADDNKGSSNSRQGSSRRGTRR